MAANQREPQDSQGEPGTDPHDAGHEDRIEQLVDQGDGGHEKGDDRARDAHRRAIGPRELGQADSQHQEADGLQDVGEHGAGDGHVEQHALDHGSALFGAHSEPQAEHQGERHAGTGNQCDVRRLVPGVRDREEPREVAGPRQ